MKSVFSRWERWLAAVGDDLAGGRRCPLCQQAVCAATADGSTPAKGTRPSYTGICPACLARLAAEAAQPCPVCGKSVADCLCPTRYPIPAMAIGGHCRLVCTSYFPHAVPADRRTEKLLYCFKSAGNRGVTEYIAGEMAAGLLRLSPGAAGWQGWTVTWAPRTAAAFQKYGFDQCEEAAYRLAAHLGCSCRPLLYRTDRRVGGAAQKTAQNAGERWENAAHAFCARRIPAGCRVLLLDDILTTGATLANAAHTLLSAGAAAVFPVVFARTADIPDRRRSKEF